MRKRNTIQKQFVIDALRELGGHPTAREVHGRIRERYEGVSIATVYSNLKSLAEEKAVRILSLAGHSDRFDSNPGEHYHIRCHRCGSICDLPAEGIPPVNMQRAEETGYLVTGCEVMFSGVCPRCQGAGQE